MTTPAQPLTGCMRCVCAWCGEKYGDKPCVPAMDGAISHGICAACAAPIMAEFAVEFSVAIPARPALP